MNWTAKRDLLVREGTQTYMHLLLHKLIISKPDVVLHAIDFIKYRLFMFGSVHLMCILNCVDDSIL